MLTHTITLLFLTISLVKCTTETNPEKSQKDSIEVHISNNQAQIDNNTIIRQINRKTPLITKNLVSLGFIESRYAVNLGETCFTDTTVILNDSIQYSIISANDIAGLCTYYFLSSIDTKNKTIKGTTLLYPACDIDYSLNTYDLYEHKIIAPNKIQLIKTTVFQKSKKLSENEEENIDHKKSDTTYILINKDGKMEEKKE